MARPSHRSLTEGVAPHSVDGGGGIDEHRVLVSAFLSLVDDAEGLVNGESLRVVHLLVGPEVVAAPGPPLQGTPDTPRRRPEACGECGVLSAQDLLRSLATSGSGVEPLREPRSSVVQERSGRCEAALCCNDAARRA